MKVASGLSVSEVAGGQPTRRAGGPSTSPEKIGKYAILRKVGSGGFGSVFEARDPFIQRSVAVKTCELAEPEVQERFVQEAQLGGSLRHRNVTTVYDFGVDQGLPYMVEEFLDGEDLDRLIASRPDLPLIEKLQILIGIAYGLEYTHNAGIVHHDVKPGNVRILADGTVKLMDFGIARSMQARPGTRRVTAAGTWAYLAPERITGASLDRRTDVFSFGVLAYELLAGRRPFEGATQGELLDRIVSQEPIGLTEVAPEVPPALAAIVTRAMQKDPAERYPSIEPMRQEILAIARELFGTDGFSQSSRSGTNATEERSAGWEGPKTFNTQELHRQEAGTAEPSRMVAITYGTESDADSPETRRRVQLWIFGVAAAVILLGLGSFLFVKRTPSASLPSSRSALPPSAGDPPRSTARQESLERGAPSEAPAPASVPAQDARAGKASADPELHQRQEQGGVGGAERNRAAAGRTENSARHESSGSERSPRAVSRYAKAAREPGLSAETRAATGVAGAWESYRTGDTPTARELLRLAFSWRRDLPINADQYSTGFARLAEQVRAER